MKKYLLFIGVSLLLFSGCQEDVALENYLGTDENSPSTRAANFSATDYYWYRGEKVGLQIVPNKKYILFDTESRPEMERAIGTTTALQPIHEVSVSPKIMSENLTRYKAEKSLSWTIIETSSKSNFTSDNILYEGSSYITDTGEEVTLSHLFYAKLKSEQDLTFLKELASESNVEILGNNEYNPLWYTLACTKDSEGNALYMANKFYETGQFAWSQPDLMSDDVECVNDPNFSGQWHLKNTGQSGGTTGIDINYCNARTITEGASSVIIAVLDHGIYKDHEDINNVYPLSYDTETGLINSGALYGTHGTQCAGIIGATVNNNKGIAGIAPDCSIMDISNRLVSGTDSRQKRADGINFARLAGASVISNSWGSSAYIEGLDEAIIAALEQGRNGKGTVVVFSAGNASLSNIIYPKNIHSDIIVVGSVGNKGTRSSFSDYGTGLDVVAPGENIVSTDSSGGYTIASGTSFSAPQVAALAGLILSQDNSLTQKEVAEAIESTAKKLTGYSFSTVSGRSNGTWNNQVGHGMIDAYRALTYTRCTTVYYTNQTVTSSATYTGCNVVTEKITMNSGASLTINAINSVELKGPFTMNGTGTLNIQFN